MITIAILKQIVADNVAGLVLDKNLFCEENPIKPDGSIAEGVWAVTRGNAIQNNPRGINLRSTIDFYVALSNRVAIETTHAQILDWIQTHKCFCELSGSVGGANYNLHNVRIRPATTPQNSGTTSNGVLVKVASMVVYYDISK